MCFPKGPLFIRPKLGFLLHQVLRDWSHLFWNYSNHPDFPPMLALLLVTLGQETETQVSENLESLLGHLQYGQEFHPGQSTVYLTARFPFNTQARSDVQSQHRHTSRPNRFQRVSHSSSILLINKKHNLPWWLHYYLSLQRRRVHKLLCNHHRLFHPKEHNVYSSKEFRSHLKLLSVHVVKDPRWVKTL